MLAQFQSLYPNGSLVSELVQIFQGKYIVRASVQIEGVIRATGMASAESVEVAEDKARTRALMVLGITDTAQTSVQVAPEAISPVQSVQVAPEAISPVQFNPVNTASLPDTNFDSNQWSSTSDDSQSQIDTFIPSDSIHSPDFSYPEPEVNVAVEDLPLMSAKHSDNTALTDMPASNVTPFTPRSYNPPENVAPILGTGKKKKKAEPVDLSDVIAKTDVELQRLGWTPEQGREYLIKTYGKRGRTLLTEEELHSFLKYLESQPDPIAGF
ncbi:hypothetical protein [Anabaena sp. CCY 9402-a]|uniref:hypothetical protein n=1 Tax=Anabaena sp. CCY 9402-a TaxID=3103867 RepID=UPI0039C6E55E